MFNYIRLAEQLKEILTQKKQLKQVLYRKQQNSLNVGMAYSNLSLALNNLDAFDKALSKINRNNNGSKQNVIGNKYLFYVLVAEYVNTGKIKGGGKLKRLILQNAEKLPQPNNIKSKINKNTINIRLRETTNAQLILQFSKYEKNKLINGLYNLKNQEYSSFTKTKFNVVNNSSIVIQSFSSALPAYLLFEGIRNNRNKSIKYDIIDGCAAPGNKTVQLSDELSDQGQVFAFQRDPKRFELLCKNMKKYNASNVEPIYSDFMSVDSHEHKYKKVKLILLDPSCSGSGMLTNFIRDNQNTNLSVDYQEFVRNSYELLSEKEKQRVKLLQDFQKKLLAHAAEFKPQRISYSTCSIYYQQNEEVVQYFLKEFGQYYRLKKVLDFKQNQIDNLRCGIGNKYRNCIRVDPRSKESDGFFVAIFTKISV